MIASKGNLSWGRKNNEKKSALIITLETKICFSCSFQIVTIISFRLLGVFCAKKPLTVQEVTDLSK